MKKIIITTILLLWILMSLWIQSTFAEWKKEINKVEVTAKIPWADCSPVDGTWKDWGATIYECSVERWFGSVMSIMGNMLKYFTFIAWLFSVLWIVAWWIMYSMWWASEQLKTNAKTFITNSLLWLIVLLLSGLILYTIAPWVYK